MAGAMTWMADSFAPRINKITGTSWVGGIQDAILRIVPFILVGSVITILSLIPPVVRAVPTLGDISTYSFGLIGLFVAALVPYFILERRKLNRVAHIASMNGLAIYLLLLAPQVVGKDQDHWSFEIGRFSAGGMFVAMVGGIFVAGIFALFGKINFFRNTTALPSFIIAWFDSLLPILVTTGVAWYLIDIAHADVFGFIAWVFSPLTSFGSTGIGMIVFVFVMGFLYSFGISTWVLTPITQTIWLANIQANQAAVSAGHAATIINTQEVIFCGWIAIGGVGATLALAIFMATLARSRQLKLVGRAVIVPSLMNINEPVIFGAPVALNPILMIPMWINCLVLPILTWLGLTVLHVAKIPDHVFQLWYVPFPFVTALVSNFGGVIMAIVLMVVSAIIWYPFFRVYDRELLTAEQAEESDMQTQAA